MLLFIGSNCFDFFSSKLNIVFYYNEEEDQGVNYGDMLSIFATSFLQYIIGEGYYA